MKSGNFGNGRFARNLLEHALMKQSGRLAGKRLRETYSKEKILTLLPEDFEDDFMSDRENKGKLTIGFVGK